MTHHSNSFDDVVDLTLFYAAGLEIEDSELYQTIQKEIEDNPKMAGHDDFSLYPFRCRFF